jgi:tRNA (guanine-N7-)-methyltransferase
VKTYVLRQARMTKHQREAYERLSQLYCIPLADEPLEFADYFPSPDAPLILEIGFGMGETTADLAERNPDTNFLGVEVHKPGVGKLLGQIEKRGLENLRIVHGDVIPVLKRMAPEGSFDGCHIFFPDPWPKKRHHKRRLIQSGFARLVAPKLREGAYLYVVTDWGDYAEQILDVLEQTPGLENPYGGFAPERSWRPMTAFETKGRAQSHDIYEVYVVRRAQAP